MPKDFAKKPQSRTHKQPPKRQAPAWVWLFTGAIVGGFVMFLVHLSDIPSTQTPVAAGSEPEPEKTKQIPKPRFDFYELLKESEVAAVKLQVANKLQPTDWMVIKASEVSGNTVPSEYSTYRAAVRTKGNALETSVNGAANVDAIIALHTSTYHANGSINVLASMQDWPTDPDAPEDE